MISIQQYPNHEDRLVGLVVKVSTSKPEDPEIDSRLWRGDFFVFFFGSSYTSGLPCVIGSAMGLVGLVSVYCDWVR